MAFEPNNPPSGGQSNYQPKPSGSTVPPPPPAEVNLRNMQSDVKSMQEQGGAMPTPQPIEPSFNPDSVDNMVESPKRSSTRTWLLLLLLILLAGGGGYYYYFYWNVSIAPVSNLPSNNNKPAPSNPPPPPASAGLDLNSLNNAIRAEAAKPMPNGGLKEITLVNKNNQTVSFSSFLLAVLPELAGTELADVVKSNFENDFQAFLYYDENGVWPIYKVKMKADAKTDIVTLRSKLAFLENTNIANFYLNSPGPAAPFRDGKAGSASTRYASFGQPGANFNYGLVGGNFILGTSYSGLKKIISQ